METSNLEHMKGVVEGLRRAEKLLRDYAGYACADYREAQANILRELASAIKLEANKLASNLKCFEEGRCNNCSVKLGSIVVYKDGGAFCSQECANG